MASTFKSVEVTANPSPRYNEKGVYALYGHYALAAALVINDVIQMVAVPAGARVLGVSIKTPDLDTHQTPTIALDVGDGDDTDRFIAASIIGQAGGQVNNMAATYGNADGYAKQYSADDTIDIKVLTAPATGATTGTIELVALVCNDV